jgi:hypothetical protein
VNSAGCDFHILAQATYTLADLQQQSEALSVKEGLWTGFAGQVVAKQPHHSVGERSV